VEHTLVRRISVFPMRAAAEHASAAEDAWWAVREELTSNHRFLVASRNFLKQKDVYQARGELTPADAITLGTLLDANALITLLLEDRTLKMNVYDGDYGRLLWRYETQLNPSIPMDEQIAPAARKLTSDFVASIPYQGFVFVDPLVGKAAYRDKQHLFIKASLGLNANVAVGDPVNLIRVEAVNFQPLFLDGGRVEIYAEGKVTDVEREVVTIQIERSNKEKIKELALVRFPKEAVRLQEQLQLRDRLKNVNGNVLSMEMNPVEEQVREWKPLAAAVTFIVNVAAFLLLAF
jgi:hypothetical protein